MILVLSSRPGMNANLVVHAETLHNVLSVPGQAVYDSDGRIASSRAKSGGGFAPSRIESSWYAAPKARQ